MSFNRRESKYRVYASHKTSWFKGAWDCEIPQAKICWVMPSSCNLPFECCPECHHLGHPGLWKVLGNTEPFYSFRITKHAHMLHSPDLGRNVNCIWKDKHGQNLRFGPIPPYLLTRNYRLNEARIPGWLADDMREDN